MAKSKKKQKAKDFMKPKLKVGKKLAKAANVTETAFKTTGVYLPTQLQKAGEGEITSYRGVTVKGVLGQLGHFNAKTRAGALTSLVEVLKRHPHVVSGELSALLSSAGPLASDSDRPVRQEFAALLRVILDNVSRERLEPSMGLMCAHISCAQTHLQESVCGDSCGLIDIVAECCHRDLLLEHGLGLFSNLIRHVSGRLKSMSVYGTKDTGKSGRNRSSDTAEQAVIRKQLELLRSVHGFLAAIAPPLVDPDETSTVRPAHSVVYATEGECSLLFLDSEGMPEIPQAWRLPKYQVEQAMGIVTKASASDSSALVSSTTAQLTRLVQQAEPAISEFWAHLSPTNLFQRMGSGKTPTGGMELALLTIKTLDLLMRIANEIVASGREAVAHLRSTARPQLVDAAQIARKCESLLLAYTKDIAVTRCTSDLRDALAQVLATQKTIQTEVLC